MGKLGLSPPRGERKREEVIMSIQKQGVAILGAGGLTGRELLTLLARHPHLEPVHITSNQHAGTSLGEVFPTLEGSFDLVFRTHDHPLPPGVPLFLAVPNQTSLELVPSLLQAGHRVVDLSGAYRLHNQEVFEQFYQLKHTSFELMEEAVFGMPELFRSRLPEARLVSNPGCYATASILPLHILGEHRKSLAFLSIDAKSGVSGAGGRTEDAGFSFNSVHENFRAYKILKHQHQPEIEEYGLGELGSTLPLVFTPHLLPLYRGILTTIVLLWKGEAPANLKESLRQALKKEPFLRFREEPEEVEIAKVAGTNYVDVALRSQGNTTVLVSALDNLGKGAAGQAIQNLKLMLGYPETTGLL